MKLTIILLTAAFLQVSAKGTAQGINYSGKDVSLQEVFSIIEAQTDYVFFYRNDDLLKAKRVSVKLKNASVEEALGKIFKGQPVGYSIKGITIVITSKPDAFFDLQTPESYSKNQKAQPIDVKGRIVNENGEPVVATVMVKGSSQGTTTNADGYFELKGVDEHSVLVISGVSIEPLEIAIDKNPALKISEGMLIRVETAVSTLKEVVVNKGYYTTSQKLNTGNVSTVKKNDIEKQPVQNPLQTLQGRVPGMYITQLSGVPGNGFAVQIRGRNSIAQGNDPLYVIDGVPYSSSLLPSIGINIIGSTAANVTGNPLNYLNPDDIEKIDVLKDADATAIYGSRGANGVVLITTKKGVPGKTQVRIKYYAGIGKVGRLLDLLNTTEYLQMRKEAFKNDGATPNVINAPDLMAWDTTRYTDWQKELIGGKAHINDIQLNLSGGNSNLQYVFGGGYNKQTTVFPGNFSDQKASVHFNIQNISSNKKFMMMLSGNFISDNNNLLDYDLTQSIFLPPVTPSIFNDDGSLNWDNNWDNPFHYLLWKYRNRTKNLISNTQVTYELFKGLQAKVSLGYNNLRVDELAIIPIASINPAYNITTGSSTFGNSSIESWIAEPQLTYSKSIRKSTISALVGITWQQNHSVGDILSATGFTSDLLLANKRAASSLSIISATDVNYKYQSVFMRVGYNLNDEVLVNITGRRDGSSRFGPGKQFANFGAIGLGWIFSNHELFKKGSVLSFGKIRGSYGSSGNQASEDYKYLDLYNTSRYPYQGTSTLYPNNLLNPDYAWEVNRKIEVGLDLGFLQDRYTISASIYRNRSSNQLVNLPLPGITGFNSITANLDATVENLGAELVLTSRIINNKNLKWAASVNVTVPKNKLVEYPGLEQSPYATTLIIGEPLNIRRVYRYLGVNPVTGVYQYADKQGNPTSTPSSLTDRKAVVMLDPKYYGGLQNTLNYGNWSLDFLFQFVKQMGSNYLYNFLPGEYYSGNQPRSVLDRWQRPGDAARFQKYNQSNAYYNAAVTYQRLSDFGYSDASFIRLKNLSLSFQASQAWKQKLKLQNLRFYVQGQNLLTITDYEGMDPENQTKSLRLPPLKIFTAGIEVTF